MASNSLSTTFLPPISQDENLQGDALDTSSEDDDSSDEDGDDSGQDQDDEEDQGGEDEEDGQEDQENTDTEDTDDIGATDDTEDAIDTDDDEGEDRDDSSQQTGPTLSKGRPAASKQTTSKSIAVPPPTSTKGVPTSPKSTTLSTVTVIPVPKTSSGPPQPVASTSGAKPSSTTGSQPVASSLGAKTVWQPAAGTTWQIELSGTVSDLTHPAEVFDVDLFDTPASTIKTLKGNGKKVICYFSAGSFEDWRPDKASFQASDKGSPLQGWPGEFWLDTKSPNVRSIMTSRIKMAQDKGCDGVDPDNVDGYDNSNGLGLSQATAIDYMEYMANEAHARGLSIGLKNAGGIVGDVLHLMEWHVNEQCLQYGECDKFMPFIHQNKPVFHIEYPDGAPNITPDVKTKNCNAPSAKGFSTVLKTMDLDAWVDPCT
jgi:Glycoside-hydrolase family GH114